MVVLDELLVFVSSSVFWACASGAGGGKNLLGERSVNRV